MAVRDAAKRLTRQSRQIVIFDLVGLRVEQVQHVELYPQAVIETVAGAGIENEGGQRADAVILDEGTWAEIARLQRAKPTRFIAVTAPLAIQAGAPGMRSPAGSKSVKRTRV